MFFTPHRLGRFCTTGAPTNVISYILLARLLSHIAVSFKHSCTNYPKPVRQQCLPQIPLLPNNDRFQQWVPLCSTCLSNHRYHRCASMGATMVPIVGVHSCGEADRQSLPAHTAFFAYARPLREPTTGNNKNVSTNRARIRTLSTIQSLSHINYTAISRSSNSNGEEQMSNCCTVC